MNKSNINIFQIQGDILKEHGFLDYLNGKYPIIKDKYLMIETMAVDASNTLLDSVFINMIQLASMAGYNYIMVII